MPAYSVQWHSAATAIANLVSTVMVRDEGEDHAMEESSSVCMGSCLRNWKIIFSALLFIEGLIFAHIALILRRRAAKTQTGLKLAELIGNAVSAGVFFATGILHVLPESVELLAGGHVHGGAERSDGEEGHSRRLLSSLREGHEHGDEHGDGHGDGHEGEGHTEDVAFPWAYFIAMVAFYTLFFIEQVVVPKLVPAAKHSHDVDEESAVVTSAVTEDDSDVAAKRESSEEPAKSTATGHGFLTRTFFVASFQVLALSACALFESMALGLTGRFQSMLNIFIATAAHRWATAIAISSTLASTLAYVPFLVVVGGYSAMVPFGVGIGAALGNISPTVQGVLFAVSVGTFLYIGLFETMTEAFVMDKTRPLFKFLLTLLGAGIITVVTAVLAAVDIHG